MSQKQQLSYYQEVAQNFSPEEVSNLKAETQSYLENQEKSIGEVMEKEDSGAAKRRIVERMKKEGKLSSGIIEDNEDEIELASDLPVTLEEVSSQIYQEYEQDGRTDLEVELDPLIIEEKSAVKQLHVLVSTTEADHKRFLNQLNKKMIAK